MSKETVVSCVGDNILITLPEVKEETAGGIIKDEATLAEEAKDAMDSHVTEVVSVGEEVKKVKVGDKIMIRNAQVPIYTVDGVRYGGIKEYDIFCVVTTKEVEAVA